MAAKFETQDATKTQDQGETKFDAQDPIKTKLLDGAKPEPQNNVQYPYFYKPKPASVATTTTIEPSIMVIMTSEAAKINFEFKFAPFVAYHVILRFLETDLDLDLIEGPLRAIDGMLYSKERSQFIGEPRESYISCFTHVKVQLTQDQKFITITSHGQSVKFPTEEAGQVAWDIYHSIYLCVAIIEEVLATSQSTIEAYKFKKANPDRKSVALMRLFERFWVDK